MNEITTHTNDEGFAIINYGYPNYTALPKVEKRALLLPLVETIRLFYQDPENRQKFEQWKQQRQSTL